MTTRSVVGIIAAAPVVALFGAAALVQGVIFWRTDYTENAAADAWMAQDCKNWATEILDNRSSIW